MLRVETVRAMLRIARCVSLGGSVHPAVFVQFLVRKRGVTGQGALRRFFLESHPQLLIANRRGVLVADAAFHECLGGNADMSDGSLVRPDDLPFLSTAYGLSYHPDEIPATWEVEDEPQVTGAGLGLGIIYED
jgi:hypothetical protein